MDTQVWKLKCGSCGETFDVELMPGQRPTEYAREKTCPNCHSAPSALNKPGHRVVGFQSRRTAPHNYF
jgi:hypothetical protein